MFRLIIAALLVAVASAATSHKCYNCDYGGVGCGTETVAFDPAGTGVTQIDCRGTCETLTRTDGTAVTFKRSCQETAVALGCRNPPNDGAVTFKACNCQTDLCNAATNLADRPAISCFSCTQNDAWCETAPASTNTKVNCQVGQVCVTTRKENLIGQVQTVERRCSAEAHTPSIGCTYTTGNIDVESKCYCSAAEGAGVSCNNGVDPAWQAGQQPRLQCFKCTGPLNSACAAFPFNPQEAFATVETCAATQTCETTRTRITPVGGTPTETVTRGCKSVPADTETETCKYDNADQARQSTRCHCKTPLCNLEQLPFLAAQTCYKCGPGGTQAEIDACRIVPPAVVPGTPINGVSIITCPKSGVPCVTTRIVTPAGLETISRDCGTVGRTAATCDYVTLPNGNRQSTCYTNTGNGNAGVASVNPSNQCLSCTSETAPNLAACSAANPTVGQGNVAEVPCPTGVCLTTKSKPAANGAESYVRKCATSDARTSGCAYNANGLTSDCFCTGLRCNNQLTSVTPPPTAGAPPTTTGPVCFSCAFTDAACKAANYNGATTICAVNEKCVTIKRRETNNDETVYRGCTTVTVASCTYTGKVGEQRVGTCVCDGARCNNADIRYEAEPPAGTQKPNSAMALTPAFVSMVLLAVTSLFL